MSKLMTHLEKLTEFQKRFEATQSRMAQTQAEQAQTDKEFAEWAKNEFGFADGPQSLPLILKTVLEKTIEPSRLVLP